MCIQFEFVEHQSGLVVSKLNSQWQGCRFESCLIQNTRWNRGQSHAMINSCTHFWFIWKIRKIQVANWGSPKKLKFGFELFVERKLAQKLLIKCWWNWQQKAFIEVNEEGSEAAAATAGMMMNRMIMISPPFVCDKPFLYLIKDKLTGLILFSGRVANPTRNWAYLALPAISSVILINLWVNKNKLFLEQNPCFFLGVVYKWPHILILL